MQAVMEGGDAVGLGGLQPLLCFRHESTGRGRIEGQFHRGGGESIDVYKGDVVSLFLSCVGSLPASDFRVARSRMFASVQKTTRDIPFAWITTTLVQASKVRTFLPDGSMQRQQLSTCFCVWNCSGHVSYYLLYLYFYSILFRFILLCRIQLMPAHQPLEPLLSCGSGWELL